MEWWKAFIKSGVMYWVERHQSKIGMKRVTKDLSALHPGMTDSVNQIHYLSQKLYFISIIIIIALITVVLVFIKGEKNLWLMEDGSIKRNEDGKSASSYKLKAKVEDFSIDEIMVEVEPKKLTTEEMKVRMKNLIREIPEIIKGENISLQEIRKDLNLIEKDPLSPIEISWESSNSKLLSEEGKIVGTINQNGEKVQLKASIHYQNMEEEEQYEIILYPPLYDTVDSMRENISKLVMEAEEQNREKEYFDLPKKIDGKDIFWSEQKEPMVAILIFLMIIAVITIYYGMDQDIHKKYLNRNKEMMLAYGKFVCQLELLISSGMSLRASLIKLSKDYCSRKKRNGKIEFLYEELLVSTKKLENGSSEQEALETFARRSGLMSYKKLVSILCQNIKRGNEGLRRKLQEEIRIAFEERKMIARRLGEEAETKLLLPMMMMLAVVFIMILLPAFLSFGGI